MDVAGWTLEEEARVSDSRASRASLTLRAPVFAARARRNAMLSGVSVTDSARLVIRGSYDDRLRDVSQSLEVSSSSLPEVSGSHSQMRPRASTGPIAVTATEVPQPYCVAAAPMASGDST